MSIRLDADEAKISIYSSQLLYIGIIASVASSRLQLVVLFTVPSLRQINT